MIGLIGHRVIFLILLTITSSFLLLTVCGCFFEFHRECLGFLFHSAAYSILYWCKEQGFVPGITAVMHSFGCTLNFHPHIHILVSGGGLAPVCVRRTGRVDSTTGLNSWEQCSYFPEKVLKARFKYVLVKALRQWVWRKMKEKTLSIPRSIQVFWRKKYNTSDFFVVTQLLYKVIWYVYIGERLGKCLLYHFGILADMLNACLLQAEPCLSETNIVYYSYEKQLVSFVYKDKITRTEKFETVSVDEFLKRLIRHIPEKNFRMIRHYGFYANRVKNVDLPALAFLMTALTSACAYTQTGVGLLLFMILMRWLILGGNGYSSLPALDPALCVRTAWLTCLRATHRQK